MDITELLALSVKNKASDLHISSKMPPMIRVDGDMRRIDWPPFSEEEVRTLIYSVMNDSQQKIFEEHLENDFSFAIPNLARFRVNVFHQMRGPAAVFRVVQDQILTIEALGLSAVFKQIASYKNGLVLVTGPTGCGKSTTLAALIDYINESRYEHVITIEDPIEYLHQSKKCLINQRELHRHTISFQQALRSALREDPDVILIGEMRDLETVRLALTAAETGHLVFGTLHTSSAAKTIHRIIDVFPAGEKDMVRSMLSDSLQAVVAQRLLKRMEGGRVLSYETMICNHAIRNLIREDKIAQIYSVIQTGYATGMQTLDQHLQHLVNQGSITVDTARANAVDKSLF